MKKTIRKIDSQEIKQVVGGDCHCMGYIYNQVTTHSEHVVPFGTVPYANDCKDLIANTTNAYEKIVGGMPIEYRFLGCFN